MRIIFFSYWQLRIAKYLVGWNNYLAIIDNRLIYKKYNHLYLYQFYHQLVLIILNIYIYRYVFKVCVQDEYIAVVFRVRIILRLIIY